MKSKIFMAAAWAVAVGSSQADPVDATAMVAAHNRWRAEAGVAGIRWSNTLRQRADKWAAQLEATNDCKMKHSGSGENLYWAGPLRTANAKDADGNWIWRDSQEVGCAKATCEDFSQVWACNYEPAGNVTGEKPY